MIEDNEIFKAAKAIQEDISYSLGAPAQGILAPRNAVIPAILFDRTRGYLVKIANQANGAYANGWYDACAVMLRRLLETLIIEAFESRGIAQNIQNSSGDFLFLRDLIDRTISEKAWNLSRNAKSAMPRLKDVGDKSAHSRRFNAVRSDIDKISDDLRLVAEELLVISGLR
ncbi:protein of unknown function [Sphingomonas sp. NFR04]|uniref:DUF4145 domain-containing protein n=1 Tax=Sphingomonas sp. NFR04 TaxID=1566283 RepID=UPI0008E05172|nr:DUF4145 domain-containing protein [Sphingomonas sp. NFR04]SFK14033.1 protein of unknown function [Sphingomonas sp. NFR04]